LLAAAARYESAKKKKSWTPLIDNASDSEMDIIEEQDEMLSDSLNVEDMMDPDMMFVPENQMMHRVQSSPHIPPTAPYQMPPPAPCEVPPTAPWQMPPAAPSNVPYQIPPTAPCERPPTAPWQMPPTAPSNAPYQMPPPAPCEVPPTAPWQMPPTAPSSAPYPIPPTAPCQIPPTAPGDCDIPTFAPRPPIGQISHGNVDKLNWILGNDVAGEDGDESGSDHKDDRFDVDCHKTRHFRPTKEAFRKLSHRFHGKKSELKKRGSQNQVDGPMGTLAKLKQSTKTLRRSQSLLSFAVHKN